jgi:dipeptide transport system substrate-binding protein
MSIKTGHMLAIGLLGLVASTGATAASTLVYCSEGSPEGFDPALYTSGTTFDASSTQNYN